MLVIFCDNAKGNAHNNYEDIEDIMPLIMLTLFYNHDNASLKVGKVALKRPSWIKAKA